MAKRYTALDPAYLSTHGDRFIKLSREGLSVRAIARDLGVRDLTLRRWRSRHPEFAHAYAMGRQHAQWYWERKGRAALRDGKPFSLEVFKHAMRYFPDYQLDVKITHRHRKDIAPQQRVMERVVTTR